eukprot:TRINITY_DN3649_c0_g1_i2.p1 TRINITY_DN3649_c0_g1~~TRINITY_DN3649_c0_g1_i2.p1  ORF type:complete len:112 (-),score=4.88 TRINITY_DN3649_c0_g1_i2:82-417(-)
MCIRDRFRGQPQPHPTQQSQPPTLGANQGVVFGTEPQTAVDPLTGQVIVTRVVKKPGVTCDCGVSCHRGLLRAVRGVLRLPPRRGALRTFRRAPRDSVAVLTSITMSRWEP